MRTTRKYIVEKQCCGTCAHYRQHYVLGGRRTVLTSMVRTLSLTASEISAA